MGDKGIFAVEFITKNCFVFFFSNEEKAIKCCRKNATIQRKFKKKEQIERNFAILTGEQITATNRIQVGIHGHCQNYLK